MTDIDVTPDIPSKDIYTAITFAPVQGFIEKSRKLRDLYGSSYILSYLSKAICQAVPKERLISPANINITRGTPNVILIKDNFPREEAKQIFNRAWFNVLDTCRDWIEKNLEYEWKWNPSTKSYEQLTSKWNYTWGREWKLWSSHAWEFFWAQSDSIETAKDALFAKKKSRAWTAINWTGESSTLSGADALAIPSTGTFHPKQGSYKDHDAESKAFSAQLSAAIGKAFIGRINQNSTDTDKESARKHGEAILDPTEQLSIPELAKRLITLDAIAQPLDISVDDIPPTYRKLERIPDKSEDRRWTGWFLGDGDKASDYLKNKNDDQYREFSKQMLTWGESHLKPNLDRTGVGRLIYAGGDDFLGSFYHLPDEPILHPQECLNWFYKFKSNDPNDPNVLWNQHQQPITVSVGFVWAAPNVPQREVLQHCREAEKSAKNSGRDRIALRILFNDGQHLEWVCPWHILPILKAYRDRSKDNGDRDNSQNWTHIFNDIAVLESRHAFQGKDDQGRPVNNQLEVALALLNIYFRTSDSSTFSFLTLKNSNNAESEPDWKSFFEQDSCWNLYDKTKYDPKGSRTSTGILGDRSTFTQNGEHDGELNLFSAKQALTNWIINLAKVGFHLCSDISSSSNPSAYSTAVPDAFCPPTT